MKKEFDLSLYLVTDRPLAGERDIEWIVEEAVKGGATIVQLREKDCSTSTFVDLARRLKERLINYNIPLIINDRIDIALAVDAEGVHIGQSDMPYDIARQLLGPDKIIGLSVENMEEVEKANLLDVDYIGISPVFSTPTKTDTAQPFGLDGTREAMKISNHRAVAIGGMNQETIEDVMKCGVEGVAVVSAIVAAQSPYNAAIKLKEIITKTRCK
ncbi:MAG: thiamine phosphate synthase [Paludibacteraceae bacterium]|nr:thiamine phosphate synthase [Paludibacteraceae bacterium]